MGDHVTGMDAERLVKISRDNIPAGRKSPRRPKRRWNDLIPNYTGVYAYKIEEEENGRSCNKHGC